jgi:dihydrodipicolinate reductase
MSKIKVAVAGFPSELAMAVALAICHSGDMKLFDHGLSEDDFPNRHDKIACTYMEMYNTERKSLFFEQIKQADVLIDCFAKHDPGYTENLAFYNNLEIPVVILTSANKTSEVDKILDNIRISYNKNLV